MLVGDQQKTQTGFQSFAQSAVWLLFIFFTLENHTPVVKFSKNVINLNITEIKR